MYAYICQLKTKHMKKIFAIGLFAAGLLISAEAGAQTDSPKKVLSPPAHVTAKLESGATISINYSAPSVRGREIGTKLEPIDGKVWRTGANDATVFESDKEIVVAGQKLPAGKYGLFTIFNGREVTVIFSKTWKQWGAFKYKQEDDALRILTKANTAPGFAETLLFTIDSGVVSILWGNKKVEFDVK